MASKEIDIYFVVLHYKVYLDTIECVDSILSLNNLSKIVVVDNYSNNGSIEIIEEKYKNNGLVTIIKNQSNLGFAKGNNVGFKYAKENGANFIVVTNNDIIFNDKNFISTTRKLYDKYKYGVLGPDIIDVKTNTHRNPLIANFLNNKIKVLYMILRTLLEKVLIILSLDTVFSNLRNKKNKIIIDEIWKQNTLVSKTINMNLNGPCLIFSSIYIKQFDGFFDKTFMYYEEMILKYLCTKNGIEMLYSPDLRVEHKGQSSTKNEVKNEVKRRIFRCNKSIESLLELYKIL